MKVDLRTLELGVDFSPYEGYVARGWAATTIAAGQVVYEEGEVVAGRPRGRYLGRGIARVSERASSCSSSASCSGPVTSRFSHMLTCMRVAEDAGFGFVWFGDSHLIWQEVSPYLTAAAMSTTRLTVGPLVSNPVTRHPTVMASMMATIAQLYDGRAVLGVGPRRQRRAHARAASDAGRAVPRGAPTDPRRSAGATR